MTEQWAQLEQSEEFVKAARGRATLGLLHGSPGAGVQDGTGAAR